jgi:hypothetical protein
LKLKLPDEADRQQALTIIADFLKHGLINKYSIRVIGGM